MPTNATITKRYYPALSEVISTDDLPEFLNFAGEGLDGLLSKVHYKNLQYSRSRRGDSAFYSLDIVSKSIGLSLPFGMRLVLNPDEDGDSTISSFPISLQYRWEMLVYLRAFKAQNFAFTPQTFYDLGLQIFKLSDGEVIAHIINEFIESEDGVQDKFAQLVDDINEMYPLANLTLPSGQDLAAHQSIPISRIEELLDCTATPQMVADVLPYFRGRQAIGRDYNVLLSTLRVYQDEVQVGADIHAIYYSSRQPLNFFTSSTLPNGIQDIAVQLREKYQAFSASAMDARKKNRAFDTELKFIFNLLESDLWQQGNRFILELESSLRVCPSCEGYLEYLLELGRRKGKVIEIRLKDNIEIKRIEHLK